MNSVLISCILYTGTVEDQAPSGSLMLGAHPVILLCLDALIVHLEALPLVLTVKMSPSLVLIQVPQVVTIIYKLP